MTLNNLYSVSALQPAAASSSVFSSVVQQLRFCINQISENRSDYLMDPSRNFSRNRSLSFDDVFCSAYCLPQDSVLSSLGMEDSFHNLDLDASFSAYSRARSKIKCKAYRHVFHSFNDTSHNLDTFHGWRLISVDGSELKAAMKSRKKNKKIQGKTKKGKTRSFYHANIAFDVINHEYTDVVLQPGSQKNEDKALLQLAKRNKIKNTIFITDRGYESQPSFYLLDQNDVKFVCRIKDEDSKGAITKNYPLPIEEEYDTDFNIILTNKRKKSDAYPEKYKYIEKWKKYGIFTEEKTELPLNLRLIRYKVVDDNGEHWFSLITNLSSDEMSTEDVIEIYRLRWQCELSYRDLKYDCKLEYSIPEHGIMWKPKSMQK